MDQSDKIVAAILTTAFLREQIPADLERVVGTYEACLKLMHERNPPRQATPAGSSPTQRT